MLPHLNDIQNFVVTCNAENLTQAADKLGITQSGLSQSIQRLEKTLDTALFYRLKKGLKPTESGIKFLQNARQLIEVWSQARTGLQNSSEKLIGKYSIGIHVSVALYSLPLFLPKLLKKNIGLEIELIHDLSRKITEKVIQTECDLGIVVNPVAHPELVMHELCQDEVRIWKKSGSSNDFSVLICDPNLLQSQKIISKINKSKFRQLNTGSLEIVRNLVEMDVGWGILPTRVAEQSKYKLEFIKDYQCTDRIYLIHRQDLPKTKALAEIKQQIIIGFKK